VTTWHEKRKKLFIFVFASAACVIPLDTLVQEIAKEYYYYYYYYYYIRARSASNETLNKWNTAENPPFVPQNDEDPKALLWGLLIKMCVKVRVVRLCVELGSQPAATRLSFRKSALTRCFPLIFSFFTGDLKALRHRARVWNEYHVFEFEVCACVCVWEERFRITKPVLAISLQKPPWSVCVGGGGGKEGRRDRSNAILENPQWEVCATLGVLRTECGLQQVRHWKSSLGQRR